MPADFPSQTPRTVAISTFGCKLNQVESEAILAQFRAAGYAVTDDAAQAGVHVVNTCAVTATAERKARSLLRGLHRRHPDTQLLAVGCMAERTPETLARIEGVAAVLGNREKEHILDFLPPADGRWPLERPHGDDGDDPHGEAVAAVHVGETAAAVSFGEGLAVDGLLGRTRSFLKVQDGCSQKCTYCIIPQLRGRGRSLEIPQAVEQARRLADHGFVEIVITGVALGTYGFDRGDRDGLAALLAALETVPGLQRIRLGSVEPWAISERLLRIIADSAVICPHLHIPLQSAEDTVLHRMNRRYTTAEIRKIFDTAYALRDDWGFGSDIIAGFPGESAAQFATTAEFLRQAPLAYLHVFPYSARPGTPATKLPDPVDESAKHDRVTALRELDAELRLAFRRKHLGTRQRVLFEKRFVGSRLAGHTANYLDVFAEASDGVAGMMREVAITALHPDGVSGELTD